MKRIELSANVFTIDDVLSPDECKAMITRAESTGFEIATINAWDEPGVDRQTRSNDRVIIDDTHLARDVWIRVSGYIPQVRPGRQVRGLNERFRFYRYPRR